MIPMHRIIYGLTVILACWFCAILIKSGYSAYVVLPIAFAWGAAIALWIET